MKKGILQIGTIFVLALLLGFGFTLMTPQDVSADNCHPQHCAEVDPSCAECGGDPCLRFYPKMENLPGFGCCGSSTGYQCSL